MTNPPEIVRLASLTISELSQQILAGNSAAFEEFYRRYAPRVYGLLMVLTSTNDELSREILQTLMLRVARKFKAVADDEALWAWLAAAARNAFIDYLRSEQRRRKREQLACVAPIADPLEVSDRSSTALDEALAELDFEDQALVHDFYFQQKPQAVIAAGNETSVKALQSRLARIRRRLKQILTRKLNDEN